jgi:hypothetical protein
MSLEKILIDFFKKPAKDTTGNVPEGFCPNCWGVQGYDNKVRALYKDKQIDVNNHEANHAFIQDFMVTHLEGIKLKKRTDDFECPSCHVGFKQ